jgi:hypothetical protein
MKVWLLLQRVRRIQFTGEVTPELPALSQPC